MTEFARTAAAHAGVWVSLVLTVAGIGYLVVGADETVSGEVALGRSLGMSDRVMGWTP